MRRLKIALVTDKYLPIFGGLEIYLHDLAHELTLRGHEVHVVCVTPGPADREIFRVHRLAVPTILYRASTPTATRRLGKVLSGGRYDLVHAHCVFSPLAHAALHWAWRRGLPSVFTVHSDLRGAGAMLVSLLCRTGRWSHWPTVLAGVSQYVVDQLSRVTKRDDVELLLNAAHLDRWQLERTEELRVVSAMRFTRRKRAIDMVRVVPEVLVRLPRSLSPKFMIVGDGPELPAVSREVARLGVGEHVELPGYLPQPLLARMLARSALFAVPCRREALSIAAIEARAAGLPVVARIPSGIAEVIEHGTHGLLARSREEFVDNLVTLIANPELRARMSAAARRGLDRFRWPLCIERHEHIYRLALSRATRLSIAADVVPSSRPGEFA
jgi:glycosyltransferase involved in cell wall biosynthesis